MRNCRTHRALRSRFAGSDDVANCPEHGPRKPIGEDRMETLELQPPKLRVRVTIIEKFACESQPQCGVKSLSGPWGW